MSRDGYTAERRQRTFYSAGRAPAYITADGQVLRKAVPTVYRAEKSQTSPGGESTDPETTSAAFPIYEGD